MPDNLNLPIILAIAGSIALLAGLFGGVKAKEIEVPTLARGQRILSSLLGIALIGTAVWMSSTNPQSEAQPPVSTLIPPVTPSEEQIRLSPSMPNNTIADSPTATHVPTTPPTETPSPVPTSTPVPKFGWVVYFESALKEGNWRLGTNSYEILADCPDVEYLEDIDNRIEFSVDQNSQLFPDQVVELHFFGIPSPNKGEPNLSSIHPDQRNKIILGFTNLSLEQATQAINECQVKAIINDTWTAQMSPSGPIVEQ